MAAVIIDRDKVAAIGLGERKLAPPAVAEGTVPAPNDSVVRRTVTVNGRPTVTATVPITPAPGQDILRQLRSQGLSSENISELQKCVPLLKEPVREIFRRYSEGIKRGKHQRRQRAKGCHPRARGISQDGQESRPRWGKNARSSPGRLPADSRQVHSRYRAREDP